jgi:hypothetical protein
MTHLTYGTEPKRTKKDNADSRGSRKKPFSAYIRCVIQEKKGRLYSYAVLTWDRGKSSRSLGIYPILSPTPLLDVALLAAFRPDDLSVEELQRLLYADKSYREW